MAGTRRSDFSGAAGATFSDGAPKMECVIFGIPSADGETMEMVARLINMVTGGVVAVRKLEASVSGSAEDGAFEIQFEARPWAQAAANLHEWRVHRDTAGGGSFALNCVSRELRTYNAEPAAPEAPETQTQATAPSGQEVIESSGEEGWGVEFPGGDAKPKKARGSDDDPAEPPSEEAGDAGATAEPCRYTDVREKGKAKAKPEGVRAIGPVATTPVGATAVVAAVAATLPAGAAAQFESATAGNLQGLLIGWVALAMFIAIASGLAALVIWRRARGPRELAAPRGRINWGKEILSNKGGPGGCGKACCGKPPSCPLPACEACGKARAAIRCRVCGRKVCKSCGGWRWACAGCAPNGAASQRAGAIGLKAATWAIMALGVAGALAASAQLRPEAARSQQDSNAKLGASEGPQAMPWSGTSPATIRLRKKVGGGGASAGWASEGLALGAPTAATAKQRRTAAAASGRAARAERAAQSEAATAEQTPSLPNPRKSQPFNLAHC